MTFEEFWNTYIDKEQKQLTHEVIMQIFAKPLPASVGQEYDLVDTCFFLLEFYEVEGNYEGMLEFKTLLKQQHPDLYTEVWAYINDTALPLLIYHQKRDLIAAVMADFAAVPVAEFDLMNLGINRLKYVGYVPLLKQLVSTTYRKVADSPELMSGAAFDLALIGNRIAQEELYRQYQSGGSYDSSEYTAQIKAFDWETEASYLALLEKSMTHTYEQVKPEVQDQMRSNWEPTMQYLLGVFMRYMYDKQMSFVASGAIWDSFYSYWTKHKKGILRSGYFDLAAKPFYTYLESQMGMIMDYRFHGAAILWGGEYIYEFLRKVELINEEKFVECTKILNQAQRFFMHNNSKELWQYQFVTEWPMPKYKDAEEHAWQSTIFQKSYDQVAEEASQVLEDQEYQELEKTFLSPQNSMLDSFFKDIPKQETRAPQQTIRNDKKISRNEKVDVKYTDGTTKQGIKYKKVMGDIAAGKCTIIT